ncbi:unnamed protein product [Meloidogyne enterolobii]|uniref:Uncharacterized protein n=1 Tax=Meloidogyne enterolobii TaxID=390850 RepID=A0ACB0ZTP5_MELEN
MHENQKVPSLVSRPDVTRGPNRKSDLLLKLCLFFLFFFILKKISFDALF